MFYISELRLTDIRCFSGEEVIRFSPPGDGSPSWTLIVGENGTGKTTILRCIALCLCDETRASGLFTELEGDMIRHGREEAKIELTLTSQTDPAEKLTIKTMFYKNGDEGEDLKQDRRGSDLKDLLVCGYGAKRGTFGTAEVERYRIIDSVYSLFNYDAQLQSAELVLLRIAQHKDIPLDELLRNVDDVLGLEPGSITWDPRGLRIRGSWGSPVGTGAVGDGYAATLTWICDLLGWSYFASPSTESRGLEQIEGIVLLDEIEQHLHPSWQLAFVQRLAKAFPAVQFIATTHSPLVAIGSAEIPPETGQLVLLNYVDSLDGVEMITDLSAPSARGADQVLTSPLFGLERTTSDRVGRTIERYADLQAKALNDEPLTAEDRAELNELRDSLAETFSPSETALAELLTRLRSSSQPGAGERDGLREILDGLE